MSKDRTGNYSNFSSVKIVGGELSSKLVLPSPLSQGFSDDTSSCNDHNMASSRGHSKNIFDYFGAL